MSETVLILDDSLTVRMDLAEAFEAAGLRPSPCATATQAREVLARETVDVIVLDVLLPDADGLAFIAEVRRMAQDGAPGGPDGSPVVLLLAAEADVAARVSDLDVSVDGFIGKPYDVAEVVTKVRELLHRGERILAVDDSTTFLNAIADYLRDQGYEVVQAKSGEEALQLLSSEAVDCILLDLLMPGLSGQETCRRVKSARTVRDVPLIMLTAIEDSEAMIEALGAGADDFISKSSQFEVLVARIRAQLRRKQFEDENRRIREALLQRELESTQARAAMQLAETRAVLVEELERKNRELEAFSYSVSHDLRAPLRSISFLAQAFLDHTQDGLDETGMDYLQRLQAAARRMGELIEDLLSLSRVSRAELHVTTIDLTALAREVIDELARTDPGRRVDVAIAEDLVAEGDARLIRVALENLLGNAWKFTGKVEFPRVELVDEQQDGTTVYVVRDNGDGFDMAHTGRLFKAFQRLHLEEDFPGTGIGLATVRRIVERHGGRIWAESRPGQGAAFRFTLPGPPAEVAEAVATAGSRIRVEAHPIPAPRGLPRAE